MHCERARYPQRAVRLRAADLRRAKLGGLDKLRRVIELASQYVGFAFQFRRARWAMGDFEMACSAGVAVDGSVRDERAHVVE